MAKWILRENYPSYYKQFLCDNCKTPAHHIVQGGKLIGTTWKDEVVSLLTPYCPYCGEKMENPTFSN